MEIHDIKTLDAKELVNEVNLLRRELLNSRLDLSSTQVKNSSQVKKIRAQIARILTYLTQKKQGKL